MLSCMAVHVEAVIRILIGSPKHGIVFLIKAVRYLMVTQKDLPLVTAVAPQIKSLESWGLSTKGSMEIGSKLGGLLRRITFSRDG